MAKPAQKPIQEQSNLELIEGYSKKTMTWGAGIGVLGSGAGFGLIAFAVTQLQNEFLQMVVAGIGALVLAGASTAIGFAILGGVVALGIGLYKRDQRLKSQKKAGLHARP